MTGGGGVVYKDCADVGVIGVLGVAVVLRSGLLWNHYREELAGHRLRHLAMSQLVNN